MGHRILVSPLKVIANRFAQKKLADLGMRILAPRQIASECLRIRSAHRSVNADPISGFLLFGNHANESRGTAPTQKDRNLDWCDTQTAFKSLLAVFAPRMMISQIDYWINVHTLRNHWLVCALVNNGRCFYEPTHGYKLMFEVFCVFFSNTLFDRSGSLKLEGHPFFI